MTISATRAWIVAASVGLVEAMKDQGIRRWNYALRSVADGQKFINSMSHKSSSLTTSTHAYQTDYRRSQQNAHRWMNHSTFPGPLFIIILSSETDYEGLSRLFEEPHYILIDLFNFIEVHLNMYSEIAWVQMGATLGKLYYNITQNRPVHAFTDGTFPTVSTGGLISGGDSQVRAAVVCCRKNGLRIRTRSGGHDYEGLSWISDESPFLLINRSNFNKVEIDSRSMTAWVQTGATLGELYHAIAESSPVLAFSGVTCPTVGTAGLISGGGLGMLARSHGLAAEHVIDARIVDADGCIMDRKSMGKAFFWAIRGGGGASFGVIFVWKLKLVQVPSRITVFSVRRNQSQGAWFTNGRALPISWTTGFSFGSYSSPLFRS